MSNPHRYLLYTQEIVTVTCFQNQKRLNALQYWYLKAPETVIYIYGKCPTLMFLDVTQINHLVFIDKHVWVNFLHSSTATCI